MVCEMHPTSPASVEDQSSFPAVGSERRYAPQNGIEVDALGALSAAHIGINMVKPG